MRLFALAGLFASAVLALPAAAAVKAAAPQGLEVVETAEVHATPAKAYAAFLDVAKWWNKDHTFSHSADNLSIDPKAGGCFCEKLPNGGGVQHLSVVYVAPGSTIRLRGPLGPLQGQGVDGALTVSFAPTPTGAKITVDYVVGGWLQPGGGEQWAPIVDGMLGEQTRRLASYIDTGSPTPK